MVSEKNVETATPAPTSIKNPLHRRKEVVGTVVSDKMQKTIVVKVDRQVKHGLYHKYVEKSRRYKAHDEKNDAKVGDRVSLVESRPLSREKRWVLQSIVRRSGLAPEVNV
ncbi:MAG: 30S ribosomal protein S17 [Bdellovibrionia bacterium]